MKKNLSFQPLKRVVIALLAAGSIQSAAAQSCITPPSGMVTWLPGDANPQDILNNALDVWVNGDVAFSPGVVGNAFTFTATGDVVYSTINAGSAYTVDFWVRPSSSGPTGLRQNLVANALEGTTSFGLITFGFQQIEYYQSNAGSVIDAKVRGPVIPFDTYTHVALTYDGQVNRLFINGALVPQNPNGDNGVYGTSTVHSETFNNPIAVGNSVQASSNSRFHGQLDEVEIFNRALSETEIQAIVSAGSEGKCKAPVDADGDGIVDGRDACPGTPSGTTVNAAGCPLNTCFAPPAGLNHWLPGDGSPQDILSASDAVNVNGALTFTPGVVGDAFNFNGTSDVTYSAMNIGNAYTLDFWVRPSSSGPGGSRQNLIGNDLSPNFGLITLGFQQIEYYQATASSVNEAKVRSPEIPLNTYTHVALTYDGQVNRLYINGHLVSTSGVHTETFNNPIALANSVGATSNARLVGQLDEVEIFSRALSQTEVRGIFNASSAGKCKTLVDADGDGVVDIRDACIGTVPDTVVNDSGCPVGTCFLPPAGLTNWFPGNGNANDLRGGNNGTVSGGVTFPAGKVGEAFNFDGTGNVTYSTINAGTIYTVDFWVRPTRNAGRENLVSNHLNDGTQNYGELYFFGDHVVYFQAGVLRVASAVGSVPQNTYTHVTLSYDGSVNRLYINGNLAGASAAHTEIFNNPIRLGHSFSDVNPLFAGDLDEVEIFNRALTQTEIRGIFNADAAGKCVNGGPGKLLNIATRMRVLTGDSALIGGFIITGSDTKQVILRGIGPSLADSVPGALANPTLELFDSNQTSVGSNDDWKSNQAEVEATTIPPSNDLESAIVKTLAPSAYTAVLRGQNNATGIGVVEVYDLNSSANSTLANISSRGFVDSGDNVMIGGFIVGGGTTDTRVLVRGIGPSLAQFVSGALENPTLELRNANGSLIRSNDNWRESQEAEIEDTTIPPTNDLESAIVASVGNGNYTAILRGKDDTTGVAVVEVYNLQ